METIIIKDATVVNENRLQEADVLIRSGRIEHIGQGIACPGARIVNAAGLHLLPGLIDDQVHFRDPGGEAKADIESESRAAVAGGTTSFMDMPNTNPQTVTIEAWEKKMQRAAAVSAANYGFFLGGTNDNSEEVRRLDPLRCPGLKIFMGSSTGNMLVDREEALDTLFSIAPALIAVHCEDSRIISANEQKAREQYGEDVPVAMHPLIRSREACFASSRLAADLALRHGASLHILHVSTAEEVALLKEINRDLPPGQRRITGEACLPHLMFTDEDYTALGTLIKCNPAVKTAADRKALLQGLRDHVLDIIATDHAPHLLEEKRRTYFRAPSGIPMCQHTLCALLELFHEGELSLEDIVNATAHNVARRYGIDERGFIREGYHADLVLADLRGTTRVTEDGVLHKCRWTPFTGRTFRSRIVMTLVNGHIAFENGCLSPGRAMALTFGNRSK